MANTVENISDYVAGLAEPRRSDLAQLHQSILELAPGCPLWFLDGKDKDGKVVSNPNIGYGSLTLTYADGSAKPFYKVGISANTAGISVYFMGLKDKHFLAESYGSDLGKATVTGYCIKFKSLKDVNMETLRLAIQTSLL